jgi:hypothetical protein
MSQRVANFYYSRYGERASRARRSARGPIGSTRQCWPETSHTAFTMNPRPMRSSKVGEKAMTDFDYRLREGFDIFWRLSVSGYQGEIDGDFPGGFGELSEVEAEIERMAAEYTAETGAQLTRIHGAHGWRILEWDDGAIHRYEWNHARCHRCKNPDNDLYMVTGWVGVLPRGERGSRRSTHSRRTG